MPSRAAARRPGTCDPMTDESTRKPGRLLLAGTLGPGGAGGSCITSSWNAARDGRGWLRAESDARRVLGRPIRRLGIPVLWVAPAARRIARLWRMIAALRPDPPRIPQSQHFTPTCTRRPSRALGLRKSARCDPMSSARSAPTGSRERSACACARFRGHTRAAIE